MAVLTRGEFSVNLGFMALKGELSDEDRQCAWELYAELTTRVGLTGKQKDLRCTDFTGEVYMESLNSVYAFFQEARRIMRHFPVGRLERDVTNHLGVLINNVIRDVLRPFLEKWQAQYRHWWLQESNSQLPPFERQMAFPDLKQFLADWTAVRRIMRALERRLVKTYKLVEVHQ